MVQKGDLGTTLSAVFRDKKHIPIFYEFWEWNKEQLVVGETNFLNLDPNIHWNGMYSHLERYLIQGNIKEVTYHDNKQGFSKTVWLTDVLLGKGDFDYPICAHWNPRLDKSQIHPGSSRMVIYSLFKPDAKVNTYYFKTYGKSFTWLKDFKEVTAGQMYCMMENDGLEIAISADHGTFIPHLTVKGGMTGPMGEIYHDKCRNIILKRKLYTSINLPELKYFHKTSEDECDVSIIFKKDKLTIQDRMRISTLVFLNYDYEDSVVKIKIKNKWED